MYNQPDNIQFTNDAQCSIWNSGTTREVLQKDVHGVNHILGLQELYTYINDVYITSCLFSLICLYDLLSSYVLV